MRDHSPGLLGLIEFTTALLSVIAVTALIASVLLLLRIGGGPAIASATLTGIAAVTGGGVVLLRPARLARARTVDTPSRPADRGPVDVIAVAHDLRSPLVTVNAYLERLTEEAFGPLSSEAKEAAARASRAAGRAQSLIDDTLRRYAVEAAGRPLGAHEIDAAKLVDLGALLDDVVAALDGEIRSAGAQLELQPLPPTRGDGDSLYRIFANLIENALKYHPADAAPRITVSGVITDGRCEISVRDHGIGIVPAERETIFEGYGRGDAVWEFQGGGIGLSTVRTLVEQQHGRVWVDPAITDGACFRLSLPAA
jgi:signal transduction histidine kinase